MSQNIGPLAGGSTAPETYVEGDDEVDAAVFEWNDITGTSDHPTGSQSTQPTRQNKVKKPDTKSVKGTDDPLYSDDKEDLDSRNGGTKLCPTLPKVTRPCFAKDDVDRTKKMVRCLYSAHCKQVWKTWPRDKTRVLRHASKCGFLAHHEDKGLAQEVLRELAVVDPKFAAQLKLNFPPPGGSKRSRSVDKAHDWIEAWWWSPGGRQEVEANQSDNDLQSGRAETIGKSRKSHTSEAVCLLWNPPQCSQLHRVQGVLWCHERTLRRSKSFPS